MGKSKYSKYITTELKRGIVMPGYKGPQQIIQGYRDGYRLGLEHVIWMDNEVLPGAFYGEYTWQWPGTMKDQMKMPRMVMPELVTPELVKSGKVPGIMPHSHPFIEIFSYMGTNIDDPSDLGGEIEFWLEDEKFTLTKSFMIYIPANMEHCPLVFRRFDRPMFHLTLGSGDKYI
ncbi:MAG: hypothetical protein ABR954_02110 [Dehalococcoidales bacterium]